VVWSEAERELLRGGDRERRRLFDRALLLLDPPSVAAEAEHARAWRQKRRLLAAGPRPDAELAAWNELLSPHLVRRAAARETLARELETAANSALEAAGAGLPPLALRYAPSPPEARDSAGATLAVLAAREDEERRRGAPLLGPHRDRIAIELGASGTRRHASAGEQKIVALSLLAALERLLAGRGRAPLVLLDDLESELDPARAALAATLFSPARQVVSTSSREAESGPFPGVRWKLENGGITRLKSII